LIERDGKLVEELMTQPKIQSAPGVPASTYVGLGPSHANYANEENVTVEASWPEAGKSGFAVCSITVKLGDKVVSKSKLQIKVDDK